MSDAAKYNFYSARRRVQSHAYARPSLYKLCSAASGSYNTYNIAANGSIVGLINALLMRREPPARLFESLFLLQERKTSLSIVTIY